MEFIRVQDRVKTKNGFGSKAKTRRYYRYTYTRDVEELLELLNAGKIFVKNFCTDEFRSWVAETFSPSIRISQFSWRYLTFEKSLVCCGCGLVGTIMALEKDYKNITSNTYHFNLYAESNGKQIQMTKDHIIPVSKGGIDHIDNFQTMCGPCNSRKGNKLSLG
jgi:5-methylcytosine-specific restriction endonuclease McrA